jgi:hypothetical protein
MVGLPDGLFPVASFFASIIAIADIANEIKDPIARGRDKLLLIRNGEATPRAEGSNGKKPASTSVLSFPTVILAIAWVASTAPIATAPSSKILEIETFLLPTDDLFLVDRFTFFFIFFFLYFVKI